MTASMQVSLALLCVTLVHASTFLGAHPQVQMQSITAKEVEDMLFSELSLEGKGRLSILAEELRSLYAAMPKNTEGKLDPPVVRYALHRYFARKYGWHLRGLEPAGSAWNSTSPSTITKDRAPSYIQNILEQRLHGQGLGLEELAVFALTLSDLIHRDAALDLEDLYDALGVSKSAALSTDAMDMLLMNYLMAYIKGIRPSGKTPADFTEMEKDLEEFCIVWFESKMWIQDLRPTIDFLQTARRNPFVLEGKFDHVADVVQEVGHRFGGFQNSECQALKEKLVDMEYEGSGRVPLSRFYSGINDDRDWPFLESAEYLRNLGALDDTNPSRPAVIIPNFLSSPSNCVAPSSFYSVCCIDECESLLAHVELVIAEPSATAPRLAEVISRLESDTVEAPRNLSFTQLKRLDEIAAFHGGRVPLHGRLFAQWMHHAYPRECRFPHVAGSTSPLNQQEFESKFGVTYEASDEEIHTHLNRTSTSTEAQMVTLPWSDTEELIAPLRRDTDMGTQFSSSRVLIFFALVLSAGTSMVSAWRQFGHASEKQDRHLV